MRPGLSLGAGEFFGDDICNLTEEVAPCRELTEDQKNDSAIQDSNVAATLTRHFHVNPSFELGPWRIGGWFELISVTNSDDIKHNSHLEGEAYLLGVTGGYNYEDILYLMVGLVGFGRFNSNFYKYTQPYGARASVGYFLFPNLTVDVGVLQYWYKRDQQVGPALSWGSFVIGITGHI